MTSMNYRFVLKFFGKVFWSRVLADIEGNWEAWEECMDVLFGPNIVPILDQYSAYIGPNVGAILGPIYHLYWA